MAHLVFSTAPSRFSITSLPCTFARLQPRFSHVMSTASKQSVFLSSPRFAVVGASKDQSKFGTKILKWYQVREKDVTPVHPKESELEGLSTVSALPELSSPSTTSVSVITPPKVTLSILQQAKELNVPSLWLQPGTDDDAVRDYIRDNGLEDKVIYGGACILVQGDSIIQSLL